MRFALSLSLLGALFLSTGHSAVVGLATWYSYDPSATTFPLAAASKQSFVSTASASYLGLNPGNDSRTAWGSANTSSTLNVATAPYLSWTLGLSSPTRMSEFKLGGFARLDSTIIQLRSSADNFASSLGEINNATSSFTPYSIDLAPVGTVNSSVEFRLYLYNTSALYANLSGTPYDSIYFASGGGGHSVQITGEAVPEPSAGALLVLGVGVLAVMRRRK